MPISKPKRFNGRAARNQKAHEFIMQLFPRNEGISHTDPQPSECYGWVCMTADQIELLEKWNAALWEGNRNDQGVMTLVKQAVDHYTLLLARRQNREEKKSLEVARQAEEEQQTEIDRVVRGLLEDLA